LPKIGENRKKIVIITSTPGATPTNVLYPIVAKKLFFRGAKINRVEASSALIQAQPDQGWVVQTLKQVFIS
jgi:hypothetical protein